MWISTIPAPAQEQRECDGQMNVAYVDGPAFGLDGDVYRVRIALGAGSIRGGGHNTLNVSTVRFHLDCREADLPDCVDDGSVVSFAGNITTDCGTQEPDFWTPHHPDANTVVFEARTPVTIPANQPAPPGFCTLSFDVQIDRGDEAGDDATPHRVEQTADVPEAVCDNGTRPYHGTTIGLCPESGGAVKDKEQVTMTWRSALLSSECTGQLGMFIVSGPDCGVDDDVYRVRLSLGTGSITGGPTNTMSLDGIRFHLDCEGLSLPECADDGDVVKYAGNVTTTCGTEQPSFWSPAFRDDNTIDFVPQSPIVIPANQPTPPGFCTLSFDVTIDRAADARDDATPDLVEESADLLRAFCDNGLPGSANASTIDLCPPCDDHNECTVDRCNQTTGQCVFDAASQDSRPCASVPDLPGDCRAPGCAGGVCVATLRPSTEEEAQACSDGSACTTGDSCHQGACLSGAPADCDDGNSCTTDSCSPPQGCIHLPSHNCGGNPEGLGYWNRLCRGPHPSGDFYTSADIACLSLWSSLAGASQEDICDRLTPSHPNDKCEQAAAQLVALALNLCRGRILHDQPIDSRCTGHTTADQSAVEANLILSGPAPEFQDCVRAQCECAEINSGAAIFANSLRIEKMADGSVRLTWSAPYSTPEWDAPAQYRIWRRPSSESAFVQLGQTAGFSFLDGAQGASLQYEVTAVW